VLAERGAADDQDVREHVPENLQRARGPLPDGGKSRRGVGSQSSPVGDPEEDLRNWLDDDEYATAMQ
jgi:hypothetical protein